MTHDIHSRQDEVAWQRRTFRRQERPCRAVGNAPRRECPRCPAEPGDIGKCLDGGEFRPWGLRLELQCVPDISDEMETTGTHPQGAVARAFERGSSQLIHSLSARPCPRRRRRSNNSSRIRCTAMTRIPRIPWTIAVPLLALTVLSVAWGRTLSGTAVIVVTALLAGAVLAAVHHAEVVAHRIGEPYGSLVLAVAVTVIEVALIVTLMIAGGGDTRSLARDTVFAAVMITCNGIVGLSILVGTFRRGRSVVSFHAEGSGAALATVATLASLCMVVPTFTTTTPGPQFSAPQLVFAAVTSIALYVLFVAVQTGRHRDYFLPVDAEGAVMDDDRHADPPSKRAAWLSLVLLLVALVAVVGNAKLVSPTVERAVMGAGFPLTVVGVIIALLILLPETLAAVRAARRERLQISLNLAYGSAMASIGLTIPTIAVASIWLPVPLHLGLGGMHIVLLALTCVVSVLTVVPGRATLLQAGVHLALLAAYLFLAVSP
jgi:Ca2+:H+ antiporter